jgi:hypothetical protein
LFLCLFVGGLTGSLQAQQPHIYVLAGQSNMAGRAPIEPPDTVSYPHIKMLDKSGNWVPAHEPLAFDKPAIAGVGPGMAFARALHAQHPDWDIYLVPCAVGGTRIDLWQPGAYDSATHTHPYDDALRRIQLAAQTAPITAILWHQGESDANPALLPGYAAKLTALIDRFRSVLQQPQLPFVMGEIGIFDASQQNKAAINSILQKLVTTIPQCRLAGANGLTDKGDKTHFNTVSARLLGARYAAALASPPGSIIRQ